MIVGVDATTLRGRLSGVGYYTARLVDSLANGAGAGVIQKIVVLSNRAVPVPAGTRVEVYAGRRFAIRSVWMQFLLPGILRELRPDLVHYTNYLAPVDTDVPYVVSVHDMSLTLVPECHTFKKRLLTSRLLPYVARRARLVLTPSESTRRDVIRLLGIDPARVRVIPYAASPLFRPTTPAAGEQGAPYFLYVGTLEPRKNLARTLRAFARIASSLPDHKFVIVGQPGWKYSDVLREAARPELAGRIVLKGYLPEADLPGLYSGATAFVYPSLYEGFGLPVVEAMACGAPVLTSRSSSLGEIAHGAAYLVDPLDEDALAEGLLALGTDAGLRARLRAQGLARAATFSWDRTGRETVAAYREVHERQGLALRGPAPAVDVDRAVLRTVVYSGLFQAPLSLEQLHRSLMDTPLDAKELRTRLDRPFLRERLAVSGDLVYLRGREGWLDLRVTRRSRTRALLDRHRKALSLLARFPFVRLVALSGACAHENAGDDDVDVFLVVERNRAWAVCLALMVLAKLMGVRRTLCLNYFIDEEALALPENDLFTASQIVAMRPLAGGEAYRRFVRANAWVAARFPNFFAAFEGESEAVPGVRRPVWVERLLECGPAQALEGFSRLVLGVYLRARSGGAPGVTLARHRLKLHTRDHGPQLNLAFAAALREAGDPVEGHL